jgi:hypothetical protein
MFTEQEKIPKFTVSCPEKEFPKSPMVYWQVDYGVLLKIFYSKRSGELASPYTEEGML